MNVLSLFDGLSCGQIALERAGINVRKYYASELDKYAIKVTQANYPDTIQLGDVTKWRVRFEVVGDGVGSYDPRKRWPKAKVGDDVKILLQYKSIQQRSMTNE